MWPNLKSVDWSKIFGIEKVLRKFVLRSPSAVCLECSRRKEKEVKKTGGWLNPILFCTHNLNIISECLLILQLINNPV